MMFYLPVADGCRRCILSTKRKLLNKAVCLQESEFIWESEFLESKFRESIFRCLVVLWKMNWKTLSSIWLCYEK